MQAIVNFKNGTSSLVIVKMSYSIGGVHYYQLTVNALKTFLDFQPGETKTFTGEEIDKLTYVMG